MHDYEPLVTALLTHIEQQMDANVEDSDWVDVMEDIIEGLQTAITEFEAL